jgi:hypothetical protein
MRIPLLAGAYQARSVIASAQRCVNLYPELNTDDPQAPVPVTHYPTPGLVLKAQTSNNAPIRGLYRSSKGTAYVVSGPNVYFLASDYSFVLVGNIPPSPSQIYFADNGLTVVLVDGVSGWAIDMASNIFGQIIDPSFYGAAFVVYLDTFFVFNRPNTNQFYISLSQVTQAMLVGSALADGTITNGGTGYVPGTYNDVPLTGGTGSGGTADITVNGSGVVSNVSVNQQGENYTIGDVLSASNTNLGGSGSGFKWTFTIFALAFDPLDIAAKSGQSDCIAGIYTTHRDLILVGVLTTEYWTGTGAADFFFQQQQGAFIDHGCVAPYSISNQDILGFWLMQDKQGDAIVVSSSNYTVDEISTPAIVAEFKTYTNITDAIGYCFQQQDHAFYVLTFPSANKTWAYELKTKQWHELAWTDADGDLNRFRANCAIFAFGKNLIGDWENGKLYSLESDIFTDDGNPVVRIRTFPHLINDGKRVVYTQFIVDMSVGGTDPSDLNNSPLLSLRWSDDRGRTYGNSVIQSIGAGGDYLKQISYWRLGMARDRVFEISWSSPVKTALNGAFVEMQSAAT